MRENRSHCAEDSLLQSEFDFSLHVGDVAECVAQKCVELARLLTLEVRHALRNEHELETVKVSRAIGALVRNCCI